jgi:hypothetical protein
MPKLTGTFDAPGQESSELRVPAGGSYYIVLTPDPSLTGSIALLKRTDSLASFETVATFTAANLGTEYVNDTGEDVYLRLRCIEIDETEPEEVDYTLQSLMDSLRMLVDGRAKVGGTAGWVVNAANNLGLMATLPQSQTGSTLVLRLYNLHVGDVIKGFYPVGQVESAGNTASLTVELRKLTAAAADVTDASVATSGAVSYTADAILGRITQPVENVNAVVADGESYYFLVTGTTAASTDIALMGVMVSVAHGENE